MINPTQKGPLRPGAARILIIDDNVAIHDDFRKVLIASAEELAEVEFRAAEAALLGETLLEPERPAFTLDSAYQGREGLAMVGRALQRGQPYSLAFVDMRMPPGWDGLETIQRLWEVDPCLQVVICSAHADYDWMDVVRRLGHSDRLLVLRKPFEPIEVVQCANAMTRKWENEQAMRGQLVSLEQVVLARTEGLEEANRQLSHLATHDALTGLPNRVLLEDRLHQAIARAQRNGHSFAVMVCDLDRFKLINDSLGHGAGDTLLQEAARRLVSAVRNIDTVARVGGDEFVLVLCPVESRADVESVARRALEVMAPPVEIAGISVRVSTSIGIAVFPHDGNSVDQLCAHADAAMYAAKRQGRNSAQCYTAGMQLPTCEIVRLESELHTALIEGQFELHYQPKVDTASGAVYGAEALIRWRHPTRGMVMPAEFIPLAEESGLIAQIGEWVVHEACRQARAWQLAGMPPLRVGVNLTASQFQVGGLVEMIRSALAKAELDARFFEVELTESAVMTDPEESIRILEQLSKMGVLVSVDDFGTGYSSMSYLRRFPIDKLKIDRSFISDVVGRPQDAAIVHAIVSLAHNLQLKVVAEGVETSSQLEFLKRAGCDQYQGYHFSPALPPEDFERLIRKTTADEDAFMSGDAIRTHSRLAALGRG